MNKKDHLKFNSDVCTYLMKDWQNAVKIILTILNRRKKIYTHIQLNDRLYETHCTGNKQNHIKSSSTFCLLEEKRDLQPEYQMKWPVNYTFCSVFTACVQLKWDNISACTSATASLSIKPAKLAPK